MSNHLSGKNLTFPASDARLDLTDVFAFRSPADSGRTVLIMDSNTFATGSEFHPDAVYPTAPGHRRGRRAGHHLQLRVLNPRQR